ncbi:piercer of microtubule wall 1 protein [Toxorhynchites rutilus septentrionalis]|uniref:piercer of microtubule wall 1 protein n=1 Tax=Toxorhynchites rutilus septentrionalis TaxID=329112 RepID=UPI00247A9D84|nr:piercer of microtubule wall 1 protein [Toxorhynchites rutilus septentrionalis]
MDNENQKIIEECTPNNDVYKNIKLPKQLESPYLSKGYGNQMTEQNPIYKTSNSEYGYFPPSPHTVPHRYYPKSNKFTEHLHKCGMFRNYSLNTGMDHPYCDFS